MTYNDFVWSTSELYPSLFTLDSCTFFPACIVWTMANGTIIKSLIVFLKYKIDLFFFFFQTKREVEKEQLRYIREVWIY